jgi:hypothetical protein
MQEWVLPTDHLYSTPTFNSAESAQRSSRVIGDRVLHPPSRLNDNTTKAGPMNAASVASIMDMTASAASAFHGKSSVVRGGLMQNRSPTNNSASSLGR